MKTTAPSTIENQRMMLLSAEARAKTAQLEAVRFSQICDEAQQAATTARLNMDRATNDAISAFQTALLISRILIDAKQAS